MKGAVIAPFVYFPHRPLVFIFKIAGCEIQVYAYRQLFILTMFSE